MSEVASSGARIDVRPGRRMFSSDRALQWSIAIVTVLLVAGPLLPILYQAILDKPIYESGAGWTLANFDTLFSHPKLSAILLNTLVYGLLSTIVAQVIGVVTAVLVVRTNLPGRALIGEVLLWPLYISSMILGLGWIIAYGPSGIVTMLYKSWTGTTPWTLYSMIGLSLITGVSNAPLTFLYCASSARLQDPSLEAAARTIGAGPLRILTTVTIPLLLPALLFSGTMNFIMTIESLGLPLIIGGPANLDFFTTELYEQGLVQPARDYGLVGAGAVILLITVTVLLFLQRRLIRRPERYVTVGGKAATVRLMDLGKWRWPVFCAVLLYVAVAIGPVLIAVPLRSVTVVLTPFVPIADALTWQNFAKIFNYDVYRRSITNSIVIAFVGGAIGTVLIVAVALVAQRSRFIARKPLEFIALFPRAVPGIIVGIGGFYAVMTLPFLEPLRNTIWVLVLIFIMRYLPSGYGAVAPSLLQIGKEIDQSARTVGASWFTTSTRIIAPLIKPAMVSCFAILFIHFLKEYAAALFLFAPGTEVMGTTMLTFWIQGEVGPVSALAIVQIVIMTVFIVAARKILGVKIYG